MNERNNEHYFTRQPTSKIVEKEFNVNLNGEKLKFISVSGVFSFGRADKASMVLVKNIQALYGDVLDLGCGYGLVGISLKVRFPDIRLYMSDINQRAIQYANMNAKNNNVVAEEVKAGDGFEVWKGKNFDFVVFNPPIAAGKKVWTKMIEDSKFHLNKNGSLVCVGFHNKAGKTIEREMKSVFGNVSTLVKNGGIRLYSSRREE